MADPCSTPAGASAHPDLDVKALEQLWAKLEESHDAHVEGHLGSCRVYESPMFCEQVVEFARAELYRRLVAAYRLADAPKTGAPS